MRSCLLIGLAGGSGSGKTYFLKNLLTHFAPNEISMLSMDNYYLPIQEQIKDENGIENFDRPEAINHRLLFSDISKLTSGHPVKIEEYHFNLVGKAEKTITIQPRSVILVEGLFTLYYPEIRNLLDLKIYLETPDFLMLTRRIKRDASERGYDLNDVLYRFKHHTMPTFYKYILPSRQYADMIISNDDKVSKPIEVLISYIKEHLKNSN